MVAQPSACPISSGKQMDGAELPDDRKKIPGVMTGDVRERWDSSRA